MNETITRAAGASHGQETSPEEMENIIRSSGRVPRQRSTTYGEVSELQRQRSFGAVTLLEPEYTSAKRYERKKSNHKTDLVRPGLENSLENSLESEEKLTSQDII